MKRFIYLGTILIIIGASTIYWLNETTKAQLVETIKINQQQDDFILHMRVEKNDEGFQILRSLEYRGSKTVRVHHQTPLIAISIDQDRHEFTGSPVSKVLESGDIYYQQPENYEPLKKGDYTLFVSSQFTVDDKEVEIKTEKEISFK